VKPWLRLVPLLALTVIVAGCVRVDLAIKVQDDGSGTLSMLAAVNSQLLSLVQSAGESAANPFDQLTQDSSALPPGAKVEPYSQDGYVGARMTFPFAAGDDVAQTLATTFAQLATGVAGDLGTATPGSGSANPLAGLLGGSGGNGPLQDFVLRKQSDGGWKFEATVPTQMASGDTVGIDPSMLKSLFKDASFTVRLTLPGHIVETNADQRVGNELTWNIDPLGDARTLTALSAPGGGGANAANVAALVALTAVIVGGLAWFARRRGALR
jgi:hypothetical protein